MGNDAALPFDKFSKGKQLHDEHKVVVLHLLVVGHSSTFERIGLVSILVDLNLDKIIHKQN